MKRLGADPARVLVNLERYGNTSAASIPLCLEEAWSDGRLKKGDRVLMVGFGGGLTWGSCLTEWAGAQGRRERRMGKVAFLFPGPGLAGGRHGRRVRRRSPAARAVYDRASAAVGFDVAELCFEGPIERLSATEMTQPALTADVDRLSRGRPRGRLRAPTS